MPALHYLTVQDMLWINHRVTGKVNPFRYDPLEEATFCQYGYGNSLDLEAQARKFLAGFPEKHPFSEGNEATAVIACLAFLGANGRMGSVDSTTIKSWLESGGTAPELKVEQGAPIHGTPDIRAIIEEVLMELPECISVPT
jgi:prophage maintenance system killer protein